MKKYCLDLKVVSLEHIGGKYVLLKLTNPDNTPLPEMLPGQFVEVKASQTSCTFPQPLLRRPISIHFIDKENNELWLLVAVVGEGTHYIGSLKPGDYLNCLLPLGNGFTLPANNCKEKTYLLVGGGVGVAPLLYLGKVLKGRGVNVTFLLGARSENDLLELPEFRKYGRVLITTEDGTMGEKGFVTNHSVWQNETFTQISVCGPKPMMVNVAKVAKKIGAPCEVSLENMMACGLGVCLCCVENTKDGNVCVCKEGPVFDIEKLNW